MNFDRFRSEDWPMLPHSEPESYPDDYKPQCECNQLKPAVYFKPGDKVTYLAHPGADYEHGIVKGYHPSSKEVVFVVYKCGGNWKQFQNYTAAATDIASLEHGWL